LLASRSDRLSGSQQSVANAARSKGGEVKRIGFLLKVKEDKLAEYKEHHKAVWPEMLEALSRNGWHNYSLFMRQDGLLFGYFETPVDFATALAGMSKESVNSKWQEMMKPYFEALRGDRPDQSMIELEEVFHLD
jgi:L-rhamnose mutarotase